MTAPVEETVETHPPTTGDRIRVRPRGVRARVKAGTPAARARVRALTPGTRSPEPPPTTTAADTRPPEATASATASDTNGADRAATHPAAPDAVDGAGTVDVADVAGAVPVADNTAGGRSRVGAAAALSQAAPASPQATPASPEATPAPSAAPEHPLTSRPASPFVRALRTHFGTLAGTVILVVVFWRMGTGVFVDGLRRIDAGTLAAAVGIGVLTTVFSAWRWCAVTRALGLRLPLGPAVADYYRALFLNAALPGGVLGDVHRAVRHGQSSGDMGRGVRAVVIERTAGQLVLAVVGVTVLLVLPSPVLEQTRHAAGVTALAALGALAIWAAVRMGRRPSASGGGRGRRIRAVLTEARGVLLHRDSGPAVLISSVAVLAGYVATFLLAAHVAGSAASARELLPLALLALIAMSLPLNVGGWGPREGVTAWSFGAAGLGASQGLTVAVVYGVLSFAAALPGALVLVGRWYGSLRARRQSSAVTNEKYAPKDSTNPASNSFPFAADARDGRPITPESV
ncbi:lysylphosphatidylglycerol synthase domain-containing protein [Streptomyces sp. SP17KL33]|nr:lysylphosphatidylglycerol synthase domain-containing protein [Streptomyces sp. SP17KL33]